VNFFCAAVPKQMRRSPAWRVNEDTFSIQVRDLGGRVHSVLLFRVG